MPIILLFFYISTSYFWLLWAMKLGNLIALPRSYLLFFSKLSFWKGSCPPWPNPTQEIYLNLLPDIRYCLIYYQPLVSPTLPFTVVLISPFCSLGTCILYEMVYYSDLYDYSWQAPNYPTPTCLFLKHLLSPFHLHFLISKSLLYLPICFPSALMVLWNLRACPTISKNV